MNVDVDNAAEPAAGDVLRVDGIPYEASHRPPPCPPLTDAEKLRCLALWLDSVQSTTAPHWTGTDVQSDLRRIADALDLGGPRLAAAEAVCRAHGRDVVDARLVVRQDGLIAELREEIKGAHEDARLLEAELDEVHVAVEHFLEDGENVDDVPLVDLVLRSQDYLGAAESELELAKCWGAELVERLEAADEHVAALVECHEPAAGHDVLVALVLRAAREMPELRARHNLLADLLALHPAALDGLSAPELERLRGRS